MAWTNSTYTRGDTAHPAAVSGITPSLRGTTGDDPFTYDALGRTATRTINGVHHQLTRTATH